MTKIGVISDTHGKLNNKVFEIFTGVDFIIHAGDIGNIDIITALESIAPVSAVYGNCDDFAIRKKTMESLHLKYNNDHLHVTHIPHTRYLETKVVKGYHIYIFGHTHQAEYLIMGQKAIINPGSASIPRFSAEPTVGILTLDDKSAPMFDIIKLSKPNRKMER